MAKSSTGNSADTENPIPSFYSYQTLPLDLDVTPLLITERANDTIITVKGKGIWPHHRVYLNGQPLATTFVSNKELRASISPELITAPGTYVITVRSDGEPLAESHRAHIIVGFRG